MAAGDQEKIDFKAWMGVWGTMLGAFMAVLDIQITNASLREITGGIAATQDEGSWISTSYLIGEIVTIPLTAWLSRVFSVRWYLLINVGLFLIFSCLCGTARSLIEMIIFRASQGFTVPYQLCHPQFSPRQHSSLPEPFNLVLQGLFNVAESNS